MPDPCEVLNLKPANPIGVLPAKWGGDPFTWTQVSEVGHAKAYDPPASHGHVKP